MHIRQTINNALTRKTTTAYTWLLACLLLFASHVHISNMLGWNSGPWLEFPFLWQVMDVLLLAFDIIVALALIYRRVWGVLAFFAGMLVLQIIPYTIFRAYFVAGPADEKLLNSLLGVEIAMMLVLLVLIVFQGSAPDTVSSE